jgi:hypothetical protein
MEVGRYGCHFDGFGEADRMKKDRGEEGGGREGGREGGRARTHETGGEDSERDVGVLHGLLLSLPADGHGAHVEETGTSAWGGRGGGRKGGVVR